MAFSSYFFLFFKILIFGVVTGLKGQKIIQNDKKFSLLRSISQEQYIIWLSFVVHRSKMIISPGFFFFFFIFLIFSKFWFFGLGASKGKKWPKITKNCPLCLISQEPYIIWPSFKVNLCKRIIRPRIFLHFFQILIFGVNSEVKGQTMVQNDKKLFVTLHISESIHLDWLWFLIHKCKMMTSLDAFFIFSKFWFSGLLRGWKGKKWPKITKHFVCLTLYLRSCTSYHCGFWWCTYVKWWHLQHGFHFLKILIFQVFSWGWVKGQKMTHNH